MDINAICQKGKSYKISFFYGEIIEAIKDYELPYGTFLLVKTSEEYELFYGVNELADLQKGLKHVLEQHKNIPFIFRYASNLGDVLDTKNIIDKWGFKEKDIHVGYINPLTNLPAIDNDEYIVKITHQDIGDLMKLERQIFDSFNIPEEEYHTWLNEDNIILGYKVDNLFVGFLVLVLYGELRDQVFVRNLGVSESMRKQGIGKTLLLHGLNLAKSKGAKRSMLWVGYSNVPAINLYEQIGYGLEVGEAEVVYHV